MISINTSPDMVSPTPIVSVIIPTYNRAGTIERCLKSIEEQTFKNFEVLVCDDGSIDNTKEIVGDYLERLNLHYIYSENSGGPARPRNIGIEKSLGRYVAFLDSDDWWLPEKLEKSVEALDHGADLVYHDFYQYNESERKTGKRLRAWELDSQVFDDLLLNGNPIINSSVVVRKKLLIKVGGISEDPSLSAAEDYHAWLRIAKLTNNFKRLPDSLGFYSTGFDNISSSERTVVNLNKIVELFSSDLKRLGVDLPLWIAYTLAKSHYNNKDFMKAVPYLPAAARYVLLKLKNMAVTRLTYGEH